MYTVFNFLNYLLVEGLLRLSLCGAVSPITKYLPAGIRKGVKKKLLEGQGITLFCKWNKECSMYCKC